jgi:TPR repeat protein
MYERALGGAPDLAKAVHYYELAAEQHSARAERNLGFDYELGYGVPHDRAKAIAMLRRAGADGWADATQFANALSQTKTAQFHSEGELDALVYPPPPPGNEGNVPPGCPALLSFPASPVGLMRKGEFCAYHHGCPVQVSGMNQMCPK